MAHPTKPIKPHFVREWAAFREKGQTDIINAIGVDKGTVSRWFNKESTPYGRNLIALSKFLRCKTGDIFNPPPTEDDCWVEDVLRGRSEDERRRIARIIE